jgi:hypothetical protein
LYILKKKRTVKKSKYYGQFRIKCNVAKITSYENGGGTKVTLMPVTVIAKTNSFGTMYLLEDSSARRC